MDNEKFDEDLERENPSKMEERPEYELDSCTWDVTDDSSFSRVLKKMNSTYKMKNNDYGNSFKQTMDQFGILSSVIRINDKVNRLNNIINPKKEIEITTESLEDTLLDLANYCAMTLAYIDDSSKKTI